MKARNYNLPNLYIRSVKSFRHDAIMILGHYLSNFLQNVSHPQPYKHCNKPHVAGQLWHNIDPILSAFSFSHAHDACVYINNSVINIFSYYQTVQNNAFWFAHLPYFHFFDKWRCLCFITTKYSQNLSISFILLFWVNVIFSFHSFFRWGIYNLQLTILRMYKFCMRQLKQTTVFWVAQTTWKSQAKDLSNSLDLSNSA